MNMTMLKRTTLLKVVLVAVAALSAGCLVALLGTQPRQAEAAFPGDNGKIVFASRPGLYAVHAQEIYTMNADGSNRTQLTNNSVWESEPMWSPGGSKIAFTSDRDGNSEIYVMDADGSNQVRLTNSEGGDDDPAWSPDGSKIAFTSNRDGNSEVYVMDADGSNQVRLTYSSSGGGDICGNCSVSAGFDGEPAWSPDGSKIAFTSNRDGDSNTEIYTMNPDGSDQTNLTRHPPDIFGGRGDDLYPAWSPDGSRLAFTSERDAGLFDFEFPKVFIMNRDGSSVQALTHFFVFGPPVKSAWSPDGSMVAFPHSEDNTEDWFEPSDIYTVNPDGSNVSNLTNSLAFEQSPDWGPLPDSKPPTLSIPTDITKEATRPDGAAVEFKATATDDVDGPLPDSSISYKTDSGTVASGDIFPLGTTTVTVTATDKAGNTATGSFKVTVRDTTPPIISGVPDDMNVTATSAEGATLTYDVPTAEDLVDGSVPVNCSAPQRRLTNNGAADGEPDWGPLTEANLPALPRANGRIVFHSNWNPPENTNPEGDFEIFTMNPDGSAIKQLTNNGASDSNPAFSSDGKSIVFSTNRDANAEIYKMNADGSSQTRLTDNGASDVYPAFSPEGNSVVFATNRDGNYEIYKISADGLGTPTNLTHNPAYDADTAVSSDGTIAFVSLRDGNFEIYTMNADGSDQRNRTNNPKWDSYPNFSPDGTQIAFHSNRVGNFEVYKMSSDGTGQVNLTNSSESERAPAFSPDGKKIAFESNRDGDGGPAEIYAMNADGSSSGSTTFPLGTTTVSCGATDAAGNQATGSFQVTVEYAFGNGSGGSFGEPVKDTELNRLAAGASVPVKFGLGGDFGLNIFAEDYPKSRRIDCPELPTDVVEESSTLSKSGLTYDATSGLYTYVWKTDRAWKGTCRELNLKLADGSDHLVQFQFT
jgi:Tol biopolymer transport system component